MCPIITREISSTHLLRCSMTKQHFHRVDDIIEQVNCTLTFCAENHCGLLRTKIEKRYQLGKKRTEDIRMKRSREDGRNHETIIKHEQEERSRERLSKMHNCPIEVLMIVQTSGFQVRRCLTQRIRSVLVNRGWVAVDLAIGNLTVVEHSGR